MILSWLKRAPHPSEWSIRSQVTVGGALLFIAVMAGMFNAALSQFEKEFQASILSHQRALAQTLVSEIDDKIAANLDILEREARLAPESALTDPKVAQRYLDALPLHANFDNALFLVSETGAILAESPILPRSSPQPAPGRKLQSMSAFNKVSATNRPAISDGYRSEHCGGCASIAFAAPIFNQKGERIGRLHGSVKLNGRSFLSNMETRRIDGGGYIFLVTADERRLTLMHATSPEKIMTFNAKLGQNKLMDQAIIGKRNVSGSGLTSYGVMMISTFWRVSNAPWLLVINQPQSEAMASFTDAKKIFLALLAGSTLVLIVGMSLLLKRFVSPIEDLARWSQSDVAAVTEPPQSSGSREIQALASGLRDMVERVTESEINLRVYKDHLEERVQNRTAELEQALSTLAEAQEAAIRREKLASLGTLVAGVAHELNTPIGNALMAANVLTEDAERLRGILDSNRVSKSQLGAICESVREGSRSVEASMARAASLVKSFKQVAFDQSHDSRRSIDAAQTLRENAATLAPSLRGLPYSLELKINGPIPIESFPGAIGQVISNFVANSLLHGFEGRESGAMVIEAEARDGGAWIVYRDNGVGMSEETAQKAFDPFFTTKLGTGGFGLGLHIAHHIVVDQLGGSLKMITAPGEGCAFHIWLAPRAPDAPAADV